MNKKILFLIYLAIAMILLSLTAFGVVKLIDLNNLGVEQECMILNEEYHDGVYTLEEIQNMPYGNMCIENGLITDVK